MRERNSFSFLCLFLVCDIAQTLTAAAASASEEGEENDATTMKRLKKNAAYQPTILKT